MTFPSKSLTIADGKAGHLGSKGYGGIERKVSHKVVPVPGRYGIGSETDITDKIGHSLRDKSETPHGEDDSWTAN